MPSFFDPSRFADGAPVSKADLRDTLAAADTALQHGGWTRLDAPGAVERRVSEKLGEVVSVKDFGAVGDGITDDTAAIQAAIDWSYRAHNGSQSHIMLAGNHMISSPVHVPEGIWLQGASPRWEDYGQKYLGTTVTLAPNSDLYDGSAMIEFRIRGASSDRRHHGGLRNVVLNGNQSQNILGRGVCFIGIRFATCEHVHTLRIPQDGFASISSHDGTTSNEIQLHYCFAGWCGRNGYHLFGGDNIIGPIMAGFNKQDNFNIGLSQSSLWLHSWDAGRYGLYIANVSSLQINGIVEDSERNGVRFSNATNVYTSLNISSSGRNRHSVSMPDSDKCAVYIDEHSESIVLNGICGNKTSAQTQTHCLFNKASRLIWSYLKDTGNLKGSLLLEDVDGILGNIPMGQGDEKIDLSGNTTHTLAFQSGITSVGLLSDRSDIHWDGLLYIHERNSRLLTRSHGASVRIATHTSVQHPSDQIALVIEFVPSRFLKLTNVHHEAISCTLFFFS